MSLPIVDLFAGAGGLSLGARRAGGDVRLLVDLDPVACRTLRENPHHHTGVVWEADVSELTGEDVRELAGLSRRDPLVVIGGAPCQPFSKASYWTDPGDEARYRRARSKGRKVSRPVSPIEPRLDPRRSLIEQFFRIVRETRAVAFLFENVPSILHPRNRQALQLLVEQAEATGYYTTIVKASAVDFGVAQRRERVFLLAALDAMPNPPLPTHTNRASCSATLQPAVTAGDALAPYSGKEFFEPEELVVGRWAEHLRTVPPGWNYKAHTAWGGHPNPTFETETRFWNFLLKLSPNRPSWTIPANPGPWTGPFHWESRRLRTPELAALQGFPDGYRFAGTRRERVRQVGNAVPPLLAASMVSSVLGAVRKARRRRGERRAVVAQ